MKKFVKSFACVTVVIMSICSLIVMTYAYDTIVDDRSLLLSDSEVNECLEYMTKISEKYSINIHLVTDDFYDGTDDNAGKAFAFDYYESIYGDYIEDDVILAVDNVGGAGNRYVYILASGTCSQHMDEYDIDDITLELQNYIVDDDIKGCMKHFLDNVDYFMSIEPSTDEYYYDTGEVDYYDSSEYRAIAIKENAGKIILFGVIGGIVVAFIAVSTVKKGYKKFGIVNGIDANAVSSVHLDISNDEIVNRVVTTRRIPKDPPHDSHSGGHSDGFSGGHSGGGHSGGGRGF